LIADDHDIEEDIAKADYCLNRNSVGFKSNKNIWPIDKINKYIKLIQTVFTPFLSEAAEELFKAYFTYIKYSPIVGKERKTVRMLESMIRLSQAHARLMFRDEIKTFDAISVILLIESNLRSGLIKDHFAHSRFTNERDYFELKVELLQRLRLVQKYHEEILWKNMKDDIAQRDRTPSPVANYIEDADLTNIMMSEILSEEFSNLSCIGAGPKMFNVTQVEAPNCNRDYFLEVREEEKLLESSQKVPSIGSFDLGIVLR